MTVPAAPVPPPQPWSSAGPAAPPVPPLMGAWGAPPREPPPSGRCPWLPAVLVPLLGAPAGLAWAWLAPRVAIGWSAQGDPGLLEFESSQFFAVEGAYLVVAAALGLLCGALAWSYGRRTGPLVPVGLAAGCLAAGLVARAVGERVVLDERLAAYCRANADNGLCAVFSGRPELRSTAMVLVWPVVALAVFFVLTLLRDREEDPAVWPTPAPAPADVWLELDEQGRFLDGRVPVPREDAAVRRFLAARVRVPEDVTDVFVWVHGWRHDRRSADPLATYVADRVRRAWRPDRYPGITAFRPFVVAVHWPSRSLPTPMGYRRIRNRACAVTTDGQAEYLIAELLGVLRAQVGPPSGGVRTARTPDGRYLHCVGHSFGGLFLSEAIRWARDPRPVAAMEAPPPPAVDTLVVFQMAARPDHFADFVDVPLDGPICLTYSRWDHATHFWHVFVECVRGIGGVGAADPLRTVRLRRTDERYPPGELRPVGHRRIVNVAAAWRYRTWCTINGAHSDHRAADESWHLVLSAAEQARPGAPVS